MTFQPGIVHDLDEDTYHAARDSLSSTGAKTILKSPKLFRYEQDHARSSSAMDRGSLTHALILGQDHSFIPKDWDGRTKDGKERAAEVLSLGLKPIPLEDWDSAHEMAGAVLGHRFAAELFAQAGEPEVSIYATDPASGINLRGRVDWLLADETAVDLKTTRTADPSGPLPRQMASFGYHIQAAHYDRILRLLGLRPSHFWFVAVEPDPPYNVAVVELDQDSIDAGYRACDTAYEVYRDCMSTGIWPTWRETADEPVLISLPRWATSEVFV